MKLSLIMQLLLGVTLLAVSAFSLSSADDGANHERIQALTEVTGMAFQGTAGEVGGTGDPEPLALRCRPGQGDPCTPVPAIPFSHCQTTIFPIQLGAGCGVAVAGKWCGYKTDDPEKNDVCSTQGAEPGDTCSISSTTGHCVTVRSGNCRSRPAGSFYQCKCNYYLGHVPYNGRKVCTTGSSGL